MDDKIRPTDLELVGLRSKVEQALGDISDYEAWVAEDRIAQAIPPVSIDPQAPSPVSVDSELTHTVPKQKVWNTWDQWEEMRAQ
ncbi:MAG TPA: hypothetical protein VMV52_02385 [Candidatus Nanopelagicaceae bacterium]|nr:hypothetical protein [Candidatus Nanopelagicaceae bacterium]